ncbi:MAG TPA: septal ring lytic transglycosylase RlpA family protein [Croceibacterium sp.]|nr:septal ring lytic transglycosylase RlpA family protein [Croceibacterium sp.]
MADGNPRTMLLRASLAAALLGGSLTAALAAAETEPAVVADEVVPAEDAELPRFEASEIETTEAEDAGDDIGGGMASWYGAEFAGRKTASGEAFDPTEYTAAHRTLPFGSRVRVSRGEQSVIVRINDRGPFHGNRVIDLSRAAADEIGLVRAGRGQVQLALLD